jgi:hypothetical protein
MAQRCGLLIEKVECLPLAIGLNTPNRSTSDALHPTQRGAVQRLLEIEGLLGAVVNTSANRLSVTIKPTILVRNPSNGLVT